MGNKVKRNYLPVLLIIGVPTIIVLIVIIATMAQPHPAPTPVQQAVQSSPTMPTTASIRMPVAFASATPPADLVVITAPTATDVEALDTTVPASPIPPVIPTLAGGSLTTSISPTQPAVRTAIVISVLTPTSADTSAVTAAQPANSTIIFDGSTAQYQPCATPVR